MKFPGRTGPSRDSKHEVSFDPPSLLPVDSAAPPNSQLALSASPPLPPSSVKLPHTVVVDCFRCNYNFDLGGPSSDIIINYRAGAARARARASKALARARRDVRPGDESARACVRRTTQGSIVVLPIVCRKADQRRVALE